MTAHEQELSKIVGQGRIGWFRLALDVWMVDVRRLVRNKQVFVFNLIVPLMLIGIFGGLFQSSPKNVVIAAPQALHAVIAKVLPSSSFVVTWTNSARVRADVSNGADEFGIVVTLPAPPTATPGPSPLTVGAALVAVPGSVAIYLQAGNTTANSGYLAQAQAVEETINQTLLRVPPAVLPVVHTLSSVPHSSYDDFLTPGVIAYAITIAGVLSAGLQLVNDRERGALRRMRATPIPLSAFLTAMIGAQLVLVIFQAVILFGTAHVLYSVNVYGAWPTVVLVSLAGAFCFLSCGFLLASLAKGPQAAVTMGNLFTLPQLFIAGVFFPINTAPTWLKDLAVIMPMRYFSDAMRSAVSTTTGFSAVSGDIVILFAVGLGAIALSLRSFTFDPRGGG